MWLRLAALGTSKISNVIQGQDAAAATEEKVKDYLTRQSTISDVYSGFDVNHDGSVTPAEIVSFAHSDGLFNNSGNTALGAFLSALQAEMAVGAGNERLRNLPGVSLRDLPHRHCSPGEAGAGDHGAVFRGPERVR